MLKDIIKSETNKNDSFLLPVIKEELYKKEKRDSMDRRRDVLHPSDIAGKKYFCWRRYMIGVKKPEIYLRNNFGFTLLLSFRKGHKVHEEVQDLLGRSGDLFGRWYCYGCNKTYYGFKGKQCKNCSDLEERRMYQELPLKNEALNMFGHTDGLFRKDGKKFLMEIKTMNEDRFSTLVDVLAKHKRQGGLYFDMVDRKTQDWELCSDLTEEEREFLDKPLVGLLYLYINMNNKRSVKRQVREFALVRHGYGISTSSTYVDSIEPVLEEVEELKKEAEEVIDKYDKNNWPDRVCENKSDYKARKCVAKKECFE